MRAEALTALLLAAAFLAQCQKPQAAQPTAPQAGRADASPAPRLVYPAGHPPMLALPDGKRQAVLSLLNTRRSLRYGDYVWNDRGVPAGPTWVRIDLARQTLSIFRAGHEIGVATIIYGTDGKPTPLGVFPVLERARAHHSTLYDAEMPYMLRLTGDGVAIHASDVRYGRATHGCIGVPPAFARLLFDHVRRGDRVAILPA